MSEERPWTLHRGLDFCWGRRRYTERRLRERRAATVWSVAGCGSWK